MSRISLRPYTKPCGWAPHRLLKAILLSGGMDSVALAYWLRPEIAITIDYGQIAAEAECGAASMVSESLGMTHRVIRLDTRLIGQGEMAGKPKLSVSPTPEWWPYRNQLLITLALTSLVDSNVSELMLGTVAQDTAHCDCSVAFYSAMNQLVSAQEGPVLVSAPARHLTTAELIKISGIPVNILAWAHSCHLSNLACGDCRGCFKHQNTYQELGLEIY